MFAVVRNTNHYEKKRRKLEKKIDKLQGDVVVQVFDRVI